MHKTDLTDQTLCVAIFEMEQGLIDADLGGTIVKKRIALPGRGKSGGVRTLVVTNNDTRWFFIFGFEKNERANVSNKELKALQIVGADLLKLTAAQLDKYAADDALHEICHDYQD